MAKRTKELGPDIGRRLRSARAAADLTVRKLAERAHTTATTIQTISDGKGGNAGVGTLADIAKALAVSPAWLAYGPLTKAEVKSAFEQLKESDRKALLSDLNKDQANPPC